MPTSVKHIALFFVAKRFVKTNCCFTRFKTIFLYPTFLAQLSAICKVYFLLFNDLKFLSTATWRILISVPFSLLSSNTAINLSFTKRKMHISSFCCWVFDGSGSLLAVSQALRLLFKLFVIIGRSNSICFVSIRNNSHKMPFTNGSFFILLRCRWVYSFPNLFCQRHFPAGTTSLAGRRMNILIVEKMWAP